MDKWKIYRTDKEGSCLICFTTFTMREVQDVMFEEKNFFVSDGWIIYDYKNLYGFFMQKGDRFEEIVAVPPG